LEGSGVSAVRHPPSKFIARSTEFTAFGAVVLKYALELFFHGAHSMHIPQSICHAVVVVSQGERLSDALDELFVVSNAFVTRWKGAQAVYEYAHM
jgi:hypothetical protein